MTEASNPGGRKRRIALQALVGAVLLVCAIGTAWYVNSPRFNAFIRFRLLTVLNEISGGRASVGSVRWNVSRLEVEIHNLTIHGRERADEEPFLHVDRVLVHAKILSLLGGEIGVRSLEADRPTIRVVTYPDGTTNLPHPTRPGTTRPVDELFRLAMDSAVVREGVVRWNDESIPLDFTGNDVSARMSFAQAAQRFDGELRAGKLDTKFRDLRPLVATGQIDFSIYPTWVEIKGLRLASGNSSIDASGKVENFDRPLTTLAYEGRVDLREAGAILRDPRLRSGVIELKGTGALAPATLTSTGNLVVRGGEFASGKLRASGIDGGAQYAVTRDTLKVRNLFARVLGGTVTGNLEHAWPGGPSRPARGTARLDVHHVQLAMAARDMTSRELPLDRLHLAGVVNGKISADWSGSAGNAETRLALDIAPPAHPAPSEMPVTGRLTATYRASRALLEIAQLDATSRATRINASGTIGPNQILRVTAATSDLAQLQPLIVAFGGPARLPVQNAASANFTGTVSGALTGPTVSGHLALANFDSVTESPALAATQKTGVGQTAARASTPATPRVLRMHWDRLDADVVASPAQATIRNGSAQRGSMRVALSGDFSLHRYRFTDFSPFNARVNITNADVAELQQIAGSNLPVTGRANLSMGASGTLSDPRAAGRVQLSNAALGREPVTAASANFGIRNHVADLSNLTVATAAGVVNGTATADMRNKAVRFDLRSAGIELAKLPWLQTARATVGGRAAFSAQGSGTVDAPSINATVRIENVVVNGERVGTIALDATTIGEDMRVTGSTRFQTASLLLNGTVHLRGDFASQLHITFSHLDVDPVLRAYLQGRVTGHSSIAGDVRLQGPLRRPRDMGVIGDITQMSVEIENVKLQNDGPVRFTVANELLRLERMHIVGDDTDLSASGSVALSGARAIDATAQGRVNLELVQTINHAFQTSGGIVLSMKAGGTVAQPTLTGRVEVQQASISYIDLPNGLADMNGTLVFNQNRLTVEHLSAKTGGGAIELGGFVTIGKSLDLNLTATGREIRLRYPPGVSAMANAELRLTGSEKNAVLSGDVMVTRFALNENFDLSLYLARAKQSASVPLPSSPLNSLRLDVHVLSAPELQVQTSTAKLSGDVDVRLRGTAARPVVLGRVNIVQGDVFFNGTKYHLERGDVLFANPTRIDPILNVEATAHIRDYDVTIGFHGPTDNLRTNYRSEPPLPEADVIALLAFGRTREETAMMNPSATPNFTESASNAILGQALNSVVSNRVQKLFGVSRIKVDPQVGTATSNPTARITIEQQVSNNITLTYITDVTQSQQQVIQFEYNINRSVSIVAVRDQYGVVSFDIRIRQRKK